MKEISIVEMKSILGMGYITKPRFIKPVDVSFLIPTNRLASERGMIEQCVQSIKNNSLDFNIEILMFSEEEVKINGVTWIKEEGRRGPIFGFNRMAKLSKGKYLACLTDDVRMTSNISHSINFLKTLNFDYEICGFNAGGKCPMPKELRGHKIKYQDSMIRFPFMSRKCFNKMENHIFHPDLFYHAGDIWLTYFLASKGQRTIEGGSSITHIKHLKDPTFEVGDCDITAELMAKFPEPEKYIV